jgi:hypothetical protein
MSVVAPRPDSSRSDADIDADADWNRTSSARPTGREVLHPYADIDVDADIAVRRCDPEIPYIPY